jgi:broad specificity phosphatase PhoE
MKTADVKPVRARILAIEHGKTDYDRRNLVHGHARIGLNAEGRAEAERLGARLRAMGERKPAHLYASDLPRAAETARIAGRIAQIPVTTHRELRSLDVGRYAGKPERQVAEQLKPYFAQPWKQIPDGERVATWRARVLNFVRGRAGEHASRGEVPAFVSHSNSLGAVKARARGTTDGRRAMADPPPSASVEAVKYPV